MFFRLPVSYLCQLLSLQSQYLFVHKVISEAIACGDTSIKPPELKKWLSKLEPDPDTGRNTLETQFEVSTTPNYTCSYMCIVSPANSLSQLLGIVSPKQEDFDCTIAEMNREKNRTTRHLPCELAHWQFDNSLSLSFFLFCLLSASSLP